MLTKQTARLTSAVAASATIGSCYVADIKIRQLKLSLHLHTAICNNSSMITNFLQLSKLKIEMKASAYKQLQSATPNEGSSDTFSTVTHGYELLDISGYWENVCWRLAMCCLVLCFMLNAQQSQRDRVSSLWHYAVAKFWHLEHA